MRLRISARKSDLARLQAYMVGEALMKAHPHLKIEYKFKESLGDKNLTEPLWKIPEKGVFTEDFYAELIKEETDLVVHSWKDLPTESKSDTQIVATLPRADQRDLLLVKKSHLAGIRERKDLQVFSSSPRREYNLTGFLKTHLPLNLESVQFKSVRGNIPTRIRKLLESSDTDGLIVAKAALDRLLTAEREEFNEVRDLLKTYLKDLTWVILPLGINPNAAAQGALAVEIASHRYELKSLLSVINDESTFISAQKERDVLSSFGGGCHQKIGVAVLQRPYGEITLLRGLTDQGQVLNQRRLKKSQSAPQFNAEELWVADCSSQRQVLPWKGLPEGTEALFVARTEAWPAGLDFSGYVWAAGLKTWQNLAQKGIWVHGCAESLGEKEFPGLDILADQELRWVKLTHAEGFENPQSAYPVIATYQLHQDVSSVSADKKAFFWSSGSQFLATVKAHPEIAKLFHACGPGNTFEVIRAYMEKENMYDPARLQIFLDQDDWRQQCTR